MKFENQQEPVGVVCETILTETQGMKMELVKQEQHNAPILDTLPNEKIELLKSTIFKGATDDELQLFLHTCKNAGLDPFLKQIYAVKRWDKALSKETMTTQVSIDGLRLIADRTGKYAPGKETTFVEDANGKLVSATAYVQKLTADGTWHTCSTTVRLSEYCAIDKYGKPMALWASKPYTMLSKVAEAHTLRKCFPAETVGLYTREEMDQADHGPAIDVTPVCEARKGSKKQEAEAASTISDSEAALLRTLLRNSVEDEKTLLTTKKIERLEDLQKVQYDAVLKSCQKRYDQITAEREKQLEAKRAEIELAAQDGELVAIDTGAEIDVGF